MARRVGVSRSTWSRIEAGSSALEMDQLAKAASALGVSFGALMPEVDEIVRKLKGQGVEVHDSRDQARSASAKAGGAAAVAVLGDIITAMLANRNSGNEPEGDG